MVSGGPVMNDAVDTVEVNCVRGRFVLELLLGNIKEFQMKAKPQSGSNCVL